MTPRMLTECFKQVEHDELELIHNNWERTRLSLYYTIQMKNPISYKAFCNQFLPFAWDVKEPELTDEEIKQMAESYDPFAPAKTVEIVKDISQIKGLI